MVLGHWGVINSLSRSAYILDEWSWKSCSDSMVVCFVCMNGEISLRIYLFSSTRDVWNNLMLLPRSKVSGIDTLLVQLSIASLCREDRRWQKTQLSLVTWPVEFVCSCLHAKMGDYWHQETAEFGKGPDANQRLEEERLFCRKTQPFLYQWQVFTSPVLQAHHEREPHWDMNLPQHPYYNPD